MKKYHITIMDNETGETLQDEDTNAAIGAILRDNDVMPFQYSECEGDDIAVTLGVLQGMIDALLLDNPEYIEAVQAVARKSVHLMHEEQP